MKNIWPHLLFVCALISPTTVASAQAPAATEIVAPAEYPMVERGHWAYDALAILQHAKLNGVWLVEPWPQREGKSLARYELAVVVARALEKMPPSKNVVRLGNFDFSSLDFLNKDSIQSDSSLLSFAEVKDAVAALCLEFAPELRRLTSRGFGDDNGLENRVRVPPGFRSDVSVLHRTGTARSIITVPVPDTNPK